MKRVARLLVFASAAYLSALALLLVLSSRILSTVPVVADLAAAGLERRVAIVFFADERAPMVRRVETSVRLLADRRVSWLVMTGGWRPGRHDFHGAVEMRAAAVALGAEASSILVDRGSNDSWSNLQQARDALAASGVVADEFVFVSDRLHLLRLGLIASLQGVHQPILYAPTDDPTLDLRRLNHEIAAYLSLALPRGLVGEVMNCLRHA